MGTRSEEPRPRSFGMCFCPSGVVDAETFQMNGEVNEHLTHSVLVWQRFKQFVAFYRRVKSIAYCETPVELATFHAGACFGLIDGIQILEPKPRKVVEGTHQYDSKSGAEDTACFTNRDGDVEVSNMNTIITNGASASADDLLMRVQLKIDDQLVQCNEVIQCKLLQTKQKITEATYLKERAKAVNKKSDVFLLITSSKVTEFALPPRCGMVSKNEFGQYFGPFASRAYRSLLKPPNINTASYHELRRIEGLGDGTAEKIIEERKKRRFSGHEDAVSRLFPDKKCKTADLLSAMHYHDKGADS